MTVDMERLMPSKHRTISITDFDEDGWTAPEGCLNWNGEPMGQVFRVPAKKEISQLVSTCCVIILVSHRHCITIIVASQPF